MTKPTRTVIETLGRAKTDSHVATLEFEYAHNKARSSLRQVFTFFRETSQRGT
jgi:hypothetical protein